ncbi:MAG: c-type cytochrome [Halobacteriovoraceae bacterium]|nr:c-type cytochrome [Halobacteriovoraceae bacterium]
MKKFLCLVLFASSFSGVAADAKNGEQVFKKINCALCHNADGMGKADTADKIKLTKAPRIAGLEESYIVEQVKAVIAQTRKNKNTSMMFAKVKALKDNEIADVAAYVSGLSKDKFKGMLQK